MRPAAAVSAAAAALWLLALLGPGLSCPDEDGSEGDLQTCSCCFYRQTPPQGASTGPSLSSLCHRLPGGRTFASLTRQACDTAVYSAFHISHGWMEREGEEVIEKEPEIPEEPVHNSKVAIPALLRLGSSHALSPPDSPFQNWDSTVTTLVQSSIYPRCTTLEGDLYILMGAGSFGAAEDGEEQCQTTPLWSAVCCSAPEGKDGFSVAIIQETGEGLRPVSIKELEEVLGVTELFFEGCGDADSGAFFAKIDLNNIEQLDVIRKSEADEASEEGGDADVNTDASEDGESSITQEKVIDPENDDEDVTQEASRTSSDSQAKKIQSGAVRSDAAQLETDDEQETNSSSSIVYVLATTLYLFKAPLNPIFSRITEFPGQVVYVLQEDLGVLCALPGDTCNVFYLLTSDLLSGMCSAVETVLGIGYNGFYNIYYCTSSMLGALLNSCYTGVMGTGTLMGDALGIFGGTIGNAWWVLKRFGGGLCKESGGYVGSVASEMGSQALTVGGGLGRLVWRSGDGVFKGFRLGGGFVVGLVDLVFGGLGWFFGERSE
ncbi:uncharacterized protein LOC114478096 [Gouania willdenowi]|uniref:uncharacterized protein LOC114478096 n=1 Tax=Gouania willdenowi TaxID=441366 RepID=UPI001054B984|nr:uncharacterized protein LOC114478096 [Gouania willdenowi]